MIADLLRRLFDCPEPAELGYTLGHHFRLPELGVPKPPPPAPLSGIDRELSLKG